MGLMQSIKKKVGSKRTRPKQATDTFSTSEWASEHGAFDSGGQQLENEHTMGLKPSNVGKSEDSAPPPYTQTPRTETLTPNTSDDRFAFLGKFNTVFLIDDSSSMIGNSWRETGAALEIITPICTAHDSDGIDIFFLNAPSLPIHRNITRPHVVQKIFSSVTPRGATFTGTRLQQILTPYLAEYKANPKKTKPLNIIVLTDGVPSDDVESVVKSAADQLDKLDAPAWQTGIQFFQVGDARGARETLEELDDMKEHLGTSRDIVDTIRFDPSTNAVFDSQYLAKAVLGAVHRRYDRLHPNGARRGR